MASDALELLNRLDRVLGSPVTRPGEKVRAPAIGTGRRVSWSWIFLAIVVASVCALTVELLNHPVKAGSSRLQATTSLPVSLYFDSEHAAIDAENLEAVAAIARAAKGSPIPVLVTGYAVASGNRDRNLRVLQKQATDVRNALIMAGVPRVRIVVVSPTFASTSDAPRVEVALAHGVRAFPAQPAAGAQ
jgi:outer membrane protein OmpA-like peptidoglycan-associated protein